MTDTLTESAIEEYQLYLTDEVDAVNEIFFKGTHIHHKGAEKLNGIVDKAVERFKKLGTKEEKVKLSSIIVKLN